MAYNDLINYEQGLIYSIGKDSDPFFCSFDYDTRSYDINMEFQHFHRFYEIHILLDKEAAHLVDGNLYEMKQYDVTLLPPLKLHKSIYPEGAPVRRLIIQFALPANGTFILKNDISDILSVFNCEPPVLRLTESCQTEAFSHLNKIQKLIKTRPCDFSVLVFTEFIEFLYALKTSETENLYRQKAENTLEEKIYRVTSYIHAHFAEELSLESLAKMCYMSPTYLSHSFKTVTGFSLINYIQMTRISNAQQMLLSGDLKITDIAIKCGFNSFSQFNRTFNKLVKKSPSEFRKS